MAKLALVPALENEEDAAKGRVSLDGGDATMHLSTAVQKYLAARHVELARTSRRAIRGELMRAAESIGPDTLVRLIRRKHVEKWLAGMDGCAATTVKLRLSVFRTFSKWCVENGYMRTDPTAGLRGPKPPRPMPRELTPDEITRLLQVLPNARAEVIVMLGLVQGLRRASIAGQLREDVDMGSEMLFVSTAKGGHQLWLPLLPDTRRAIEAYYREIPGQTGPLVRSENFPNRGLTPDRIYKLVVAWMYEAGVKQHPKDGRSTHALRHTTAGAMLDEGSDIRDVQAALGHATLASTYPYLRKRIANDALRDAMGRRRYLALPEAS